MKYSYLQVKINILPLPPKQVFIYLSTAVLEFLLCRPGWPSEIHLPLPPECWG